MHDKSNIVKDNPTDDNDSLIIMEPMFFRSPLNPHTGCSVVQPTEIMNLTTEGHMVIDNIINSYMILLVQSEKMYLRIVNSSFLIALRNDGWKKAQTYLKESQYAKGTWMTSRLIFIPGFIGEQTRGHWINIIIENVDKSKRIIYVADSLGIEANYDDIVNSFSGTPFQFGTGINQWIFLNGMIQQGNDCAVFTLEIFTKFLEIQSKTTYNSNMQTLHNIKYNTIPSIFGKTGRKHIATCIIQKKLIIVWNQ